MKSYEAQSIQEAMEMIRKELGDDAVILSTNRKGGNFEVVAARDGEETETKTTTKPSAPKAINRAFQKDWLPEGYSEIGRLQDAVTALFDIVGSGGRVRGDNLAPLYHRLVSSGMSREVSCRIAEGLRANGQTDVYVSLKGMLPIYDKRKRIRALVGPTGAGKTTTLAKLAADTAFGEKLKTAIITTDTHRIAATEQIKIYAKIMDIPMAIASDNGSYKKAVERFAGVDVIYVDTPGRSYDDREALESLNRMLRSGRDTEACLVLSMTSTREHLFKSVEQYGSFDNTNVIFTKLDECSRYGAICDIVEKTGIPVSYLTMGQNVPEDIEKATPERIAELILGR
ncbi:MAG: hypothetical protein PHN75_01100 [Syntrophales bacterium]|nr:hypothetical protein [Syntrophales bacterium]